MLKSQLVNPRRLRSLQRAGLCVIVDCRFDLADPDAKQAAWLEGHIPGAMYAHLDNDLSAAVSGTSGRHPLPDPVRFGEFLASVGWSPEKLLVAYDDASGAVAARLWWLMRYFGHSSALLDGGIRAWQRAGYELESGTIIMQAPPVVQLSGDSKMTVSTAEVQNSIDSGRLRLVDARARQRYTGEVEPLDARAGHIPGSINRPFSKNLDEAGQFKDQDVLREEFEALMGDSTPDQIAHSCGSGVTACHNLFAMELAGLASSKLYPGSWSEWIRDPDRPIATGDS